MQNTLSFDTRLTQDSPNTNFFKKTKRQIAGSGLLEKIQFVQWRISEKIQQKTDNVNVIRLAALFAVFPRMGIYAVEFSHAHLAKRFGELYNIPAPSRKSICTWEKAFRDLGFLKIPEHKASKPKTRVFTREFWDLARERMPKMSYISVPVTWHPANEVLQVKTTQDLSKDPETKKRADDIDHVEIRQSRAPSQIKNSRPPKHRNDAPKGLSQFENSVSWWLFQNKNRGSYRRACLIFAEFLKMSGVDDYYTQLQRAWTQCRDVERPGLISDMIRNLGSSVEDSLPGGGASPPVAFPPLCSVPDLDENSTDPEIAKLRIAIFFGGDYSGKYPHVLAEYQRSTDARREEIIKVLAEGDLCRSTL